MATDFIDVIQSYNCRNCRLSFCWLSLSGTSSAVAEKEGGIARAAVAQPGGLGTGIFDCGIVGASRSVGDAELEFAEIVRLGSCPQLAASREFRGGVSLTRP